jgi:proline iminopeptidase
VEPSEGHVKVSGFNLYYRSFGKPDKGTVLALAGGPLCTHDYLLPMADLVQYGYRVVVYDQLGCGKSDRPRASVYNVHSRAVEEVEGIRKALRLGRIHLFGNSYGGALALEVALRYPESLRSLVISGGFADYALLESEWDRLFLQLPRGIQNTIARCEAKGDIKNPRYIAAVDVWYHKHFCRLRVWPYDFWHTWEDLCDSDSDHAGRMKGWNITDRLPEIRLPCLITVGKYDITTPKCAQAIHRSIRGSKLVIFEKGSHMPMWEDRVEFIEVMRDFLDSVEKDSR